MLEIHADGEFSLDSEEEEVTAVISKGEKFIVGTDSLIGDIKNKNIKLIEVKKGKVTDVIIKVKEYIRTLDERVTPTVVISAGIFNISSSN